MEPPAQRFARLILALEELAMDETAALRAGDYTTANEIADRAEPIIDWMVAYANVVTPALRDRLAIVQARRATNVEYLECAITRTHDELQELALSRRRVAQIAPVYGRAAIARPRLSAVG